MAELKHLRALEGGADNAANEARSDEQIVEGLLAGREWAAEALYDRLQPVVDRALRRVLQSNADDHDDLAQIVFERIVRTLMQRKFAGACSLPTWATAIAAHVGIDALRARVRERAGVWEDRTRGDEQAARVSSGNLERQLEARAEITELHGILGSMDAAQAETVLLHDVHGHELSEIALIMGVSIAAAQSRLVRGRKDLLRRAPASGGRREERRKRGQTALGTPA
jgi:RNA polymerase sigma-70 factor (ECF subfamily)